MTKKSILITFTFSDCNAPPVIPHGNVSSSNGTVFPSTVHYECDAGYESSEGITTDCLDSGKWSEVQQTCTIKGKRHM